MDFVDIGSENGKSAASARESRRPLVGSFFHLAGATHDVGLRFELHKYIQRAERKTSVLAYHLLAHGEQLDSIFLPGTLGARVHAAGIPSARTPTVTGLLSDTCEKCRVLMYVDPIHI